LVNDTFDTEKVAVLSNDIFHQQEPILMLEKLHVKHAWFCGYFQDKKIFRTVTVTHPENMGRNFNDGS
jgi:hypothetical protein